MDDFEKVMRDHGVGGRGKRINTLIQGSSDITGISLLPAAPTTHIQVDSKPTAKGYIDDVTVIRQGLKGVVPGNVRAGVKYGGESAPNQLEGTFTADATAIAANMLAGKTAGINGNMVTGTMPNRAGSQTAAAGIGAAVPGQIDVYPALGSYDGISAIARIMDADFIAANIIAGKDLFGIGGTAKRWAEFSGTMPDGQSTLTLNPSFTPSKASYVLTYTSGGTAFIRVGYKNTAQSKDHMTDVNTVSGTGTYNPSYITFGTNSITISTSGTTLQNYSLFCVE